MPHIADHFRLGWTIDTSRPTFAVFRHVHTTPRDHSLPDCLDDCVTGRWSRYLEFLVEANEGVS